MVKVVRFPPGGWRLMGGAERETIRSAHAVFCIAGDEKTLGELQEHGIKAQAAPIEGVPDGALLVLPEPQRGPLYELLQVVDRLLGPGGCPWDQEQTHESLKRHLLEEAYEVLDAIDAGSDERLKEELGDLLLQPFMHAQMRKRDGGWDIDDVAGDLVDKLVRRHPHVFGDLALKDAESVLRNWDRLKKEEKGEQGSRLGGIPSGMASLLRAYEVSKRASRVGFEWPSVEAVFDKLREEEVELREAIAGGDTARIEEELGDLLFTVVNLARWAGVEPEEALRRMVNRFSERFRQMEAAASKPLEDLTPAEWDALWEDSKKAEPASHE